MGLREAINAEAQSQSAGRCAVARLLASGKLSKQDVKDLLEMLADVSVSCTAISRALAKHSALKASALSLQRHRKKVCSCPS